MSIELQRPPEPSVTAMVQGIVDDAQELIKQQFALIRAEIKEDVRKGKEAAFSLAVGLVIAFLGCSLLALMLTELLHWSSPDLPLWACHTIVGGILLAIGAALAFLGIKKFKSMNPMPEQSLTALKENLQWTTSRK
jgi:cytochrome c biogenesis protein CcdA